MCGHTSSLCQTAARLASPGGKWIVSCHPCSGVERVGRGERGEGEADGEGKGEGREKEEEERRGEERREGEVEREKGVV